MPKIYPHDFSEKELTDGCKRCIDNARGLLAGAKILNENAITEQYALGLYMYAVEEYGKAIMLKSAITGNEEKYQIQGWLLGHGKPNKDTNSHDGKMIIGFDNLPNDCRTVRVTAAIPFKRTITLGHDNQLSTPESGTGTFFDTTNVNRFVYDLDLKTACFYIDWDQNNKDWKYHVATKPEDLKKYIECLEDALAEASRQYGFNN